MFKSLKGLVAGILAGTALGVLFAPKKGSDIRKEFKKEIKDGGVGLHTAKETLTDMSKDIGDTCKEGYENIPETKKKEAMKIVKKAEQKAKKVINKVKNKLVGKKK